MGINLSFDRGVQSRDDWIEARTSGDVCMNILSLLSCLVKKDLQISSVWHVVDFSSL